MGKWSALLVVAVIAVSGTVLSAVVDDEEELDPFDMLNFDHTNMKMRKKTPSEPDQPTKESGTQEKVQESEPAQSIVTDPPKENPRAEPVTEAPRASEQQKAEGESCPALTLFQQFVSRLLRLADGKVSQLNPNVPTELCLRLHLTYYQMEMLETFRRDHSRNNVFAAHDILTEAVQGVHILSHDDPSLHYLWVEKYFGVTMEQAREFLQMVTLVVVLAVTFRMIRWFWVAISIFAISVAMTWYRLYKKEAAKLHGAMMDAPAGCGKLPHEESSFWAAMSSYMKSKFTFQQDICAEYYERLVTDPRVMVTPMEAIAVTVVQTLLKPLHIVGTAISEFMRALLKDLPVQWQFITLLLVCFFLVLTLFLLSRYRLRIPFFLALEPSHRRDDEVKALRDTIQQLEVTIRNMDSGKQESPPQRQASLPPAAPPNTTIAASTISGLQIVPPSTAGLPHPSSASDRPLPCTDEDGVKRHQPRRKVSSSRPAVRQTDGSETHRDDPSSDSEETDLKTVQKGQVTAEGNVLTCETQGDSLHGGCVRASSSFCDSGSISSTLPFSVQALGLCARDLETLGSVDSADRVGESGDANLAERPPPAKD